MDARQHEPRHRAAARAARPRGARGRGGTLREQLAAVLAETTVADAVEVYAAIRAAAPGGLGAAPSEDVRATPTVTLREAMALAADRDAIAREYVTDFALTFEIGAPAVRERARRGARLGRRRRRGVSRAARGGTGHARRAKARPAGRRGARRAGRPRFARRAGSAPTRAAGRSPRFDAELRDPRNTRNPGTTADLVCAALFVVILEGHWQP